MTAKRSKASFDYKHLNIKECYVRLDRNFLLRSSSLSQRKTGRDVKWDGNESGRNVAKKIVSKKLKTRKTSEKDLESSGNESEENYRNVSKKRKVLKKSEKDSDFSGNESDVVAQEKTPKKHILKKPENDLESSESESNENDNMVDEKILKKRRACKKAEKYVRSENEESSESEDIESITFKEKQLKLNKDKLDEANRKSITCKICKEEFKTYSSLVSHQQLHKTKVFRCTICRESFKHRTSYMCHHKRMHPEIACYSCEFPGCDASFKTLKRRKDHEYSHYKYMCRFCKKRYASRGFMRLHVKEVHPTKV